MKTTTRIVIGLVLLTLWSCDDSTTQKNNQKTKDLIENNSHSSISFIKGHYQINDSTILNNKNLQILIDILEKENIAEKKKVSEIPVFIKSFLDNLTDSFSIANPGENWQVGCCVIDEKLPSRQLIYLGIGKNIALMTYFTGGIGKSEHILIIKFKDNQILDFWCGNVLKDLTNKIEILNYLKTNKNRELGLNTNITDL